MRFINQTLMSDPDDEFLDIIYTDKILRPLLDSERPVPFEDRENMGYGLNILNDGPEDIFGK